MAKKKFPKHVFVGVEKDTDGSSFLVAHDDAAGHAEINKEIEVAIYDFVRVVKVRADATFK